MSSVSKNFSSSPLQHKGECLGTWAFFNIKGKAVVVCDVCKTMYKASDRVADDAFRENWLGYLLSVLSNEGYLVLEKEQGG